MYVVIVEIKVMTRETTAIPGNVYLLLQPYSLSITSGAALLKFPVTGQVCSSTLKCILQICIGLQKHKMFSSRYSNRAVNHSNKVATILEKECSKLCSYK